MDIAGSNKRIIKNTVFLYFRMLLIMSTNFIAVRIVLKSLGDSDYGVYTVVGGIVAMLSFINSTLASGAQRYITFALGKNDTVFLKLTFSIVFWVHIGLILIILLIAETGGLWFLNNKINIPFTRVKAALFVYQFSIVTCLASIFQTPFIASLIAHEKMDIYAFISMADAVLKLGFTLMLLFIKGDKLIIYALCMMAVNFFTAIIYCYSCRRRFTECRFGFQWDAFLFKEIFAFSGWNTIGVMGAMLSNQGVNILLNMFFSPVVNAARGISMQVNSLLTTFINNFQTPIKPQIIKAYARGDLNQLIRLVCSGAKYAFGLLLFLFIPLFIEMDYVLKMWLGACPPYTTQFSKLILIYALLYVFDRPVVAALYATGKMMLSNCTTGLLLLGVLPISYLFLKQGGGAVLPFYVLVFTMPVLIMVELIILKKYISFPIFRFIAVFVRCLVSLMLAFPIPYLLSMRLEKNFVYLMVVFIVSVLCNLVVILFVLLNKAERGSLVEFIRSKMLSLLRRNHALF